MNQTQKREKVLIVDDTPENLDVLMAALSDRYAVVAARDGEKALSIVQGANPPDIVLLDVMMPGMDGYQVCERMQENPATREIPVIFLTALVDEQDELRGLSVGAVDYVRKPVSVPLVRARVRTHLNLALAQRQLAAQVAELTAAAKLRDDVDQIMRHDLKGPLNPVIGFTSMMRNSPDLTEKHQQYVEFIHESGLKMLEMINRSLDLFKMESGTYDYQPVAMDLTAVATQVAEDLFTLAAEKRVSITRQGDEVVVAGDELLCYSMLANLVKNAIEASPADAEVKIECGSDGECGEVRISNSGAVPEIMRETFFEKYSTVGKKGGSGIGTYSARLMVETMAGEINMESSEADGTRITVRLPAAEFSTD